MDTNSPETVEHSHASSSQLNSPPPLTRDTSPTTPFSNNSSTSLPGLVKGLSFDSPFAAQTPIVRTQATVVTHHEVRGGEMFAHNHIMHHKTPHGHLPISPAIYELNLNWHLGLMLEDVRHLTWGLNFRFQQNMDAIDKFGASLERTIVMIKKVNLELKEAGFQAEGGDIPKVESLKLKEEIKRLSEEISEPDSEAKIPVFVGEADMAARKLKRAKAKDTVTGVTASQGNNNFHQKCEGKRTMEDERASETSSPTPSLD